MSSHWLLFEIVRGLAGKESGPRSSFGYLRDRSSYTFRHFMIYLFMCFLDVLCGVVFDAFTLASYLRYRPSSPSRQFRG